MAKTKITITPENPLVKWYKATSSEKFKLLAPEEKEAARKQFIEKFSESEDEQGKIERTKALDFATRDLQNDVFNDPAFQNADTTDQIEYIRANMYGTGRLDPVKEKERQSKGKLYKFFNPISSRDLAAEEYDKYYNAAIEASVKAPFTTGVKQAYAVATGNEELSQKTQKEVQELEKLQKRAPIASAIAETVPQAAVGVGAGLVTGGTALPFLARLGVGALVQGATAPVTSVERTSEGSSVKELQSEKQKTAALSGILNVVGDVATAPAVTRKLGEAGRWFGGVVSEEKRVSDLADDLLREVAEKGKPKDVLSKLTSASGKLQTVPEDKLVFTGAAADLPQLAEMQAGVARADIGKETFDRFQRPIQSQTTNIAKFSTDASKSKIASSFIRSKAVALDGFKEEATKEATQLYTSARESGIGQEPLGMTTKELYQKISEYIQLPDNALKVKALENTEAMRRLKSAINVPLKVKDIMELQQSIAGEIAPIDGDQLLAIRDIIGGSLSTSQNKGVEELYNTYKAGQSALEDSLSYTSSVYNRARVSPETLTVEEIGNFIENSPELVKPMQLSVASRITDAINATPRTDTELAISLGRTYTKFAPYEKQIQTLFANDKGFLEDFNKLMQAGKAETQLVTTAGTAGGEVRSGGIKNILAGTGAQVGGGRTIQYTGGFDIIQNALNSKTRQLLRDSIDDKALTLKILGRAKDIQEGRIKYEDLWNAYQGLPRVTAGAVGKAVSVSPEGLEDKPKKPLSPVFPEDTIPTPEVSSLSITNPIAATPQQEDTSSVERLKTSGIIESEGIEPLAYDDTEGNRTAGIGFNMDTPNATKVWELAGIPKNFEDVYNRKAELTEPEAMKLAQASFKIAMDDANSIFPNFETLPEDKQDALLHLSYQLGAPRLRKFRKLRAAVANEDFAAAAEEVMNSELPKQTPNRAAKITELLYPTDTQPKSKRIKYDSKGNKLG